MLPLWGLGGARGGGVPHPKRHGMTCARFLQGGLSVAVALLFFSSPGCQQAQGANKPCCIRGLQGGRFWVLGLARPLAGQAAALSSGQCASREGGRPGQISTRQAGSAGCCLSRQGLQLQLSSQRIFLKKSGCICLRRRVLAKGPALFASSLPPPSAFLAFPTPLPPRSLAGEAGDPSMWEHTARRASVERVSPQPPRSCAASVCATEARGYDRMRCRHLIEARSR